MEQAKSQAKALAESKPISDDHKLIAYWAAHGMEPLEISKELGYALQTIKTVLKDKKVKLFIEKVRYKIYGEDPAIHLKDCAKKAIIVAEDLMMNKKTKDHVRLLAAQDFMNREFGKAGIDDGMVEGTVRKILQMLQKPPESVTRPSDIENAEYSEIEQSGPVEEKVQSPIKEADKIDDWLDNNLK